MKRPGIAGNSYFKIKQEGVWGQVYNFCEICPITRGYVKQIRRMFLRHCPLEEQNLQKKTIQLCLLVWGSVGTIISWLFFRNPGIYTLALALFYSVAVSKELMRIAEKNIERRILRQLEKALNDVQHCYYDTHSVTGALEEVAGLNDYEMRLHIEALISVLESENLMETVEEYNRLSGNRFLKMFLSQCVAIQEYGDCERNGESVFIRNLNDLRADILNYLLQMDRLQLEFSGLTFITLVPLLALPLIRSTAIATLPELTGFYNGVFGVILPVVYLLVTIAIYAAIVEMQELDAAASKKHRLLYRLERNRTVTGWLDAWEKRNYGNVQKQKQRLRRAGESISPRLWILEKTVYLCMAVILGAGLFLHAHGKDRNRLISEYAVAESISQKVNEEQKEELAVIISKLVARYCEEENITYERLLYELQHETQLTERFAELAAKECEQRIREYRSCHMKWYEIGIILLCALLAYEIPDLRLWYKTALMRMNMLSEVTQFQSIILMQMFIPDITVLRILTSMEQFAFIFRSGIQECINEYSYSVEESLSTMREAESYEPFRRLCDNLLMVDKIGIIRAFEEITQDREHFQKQREEDTYRMIRKKAGQAKVLAFVPMLTIMFSYLIFPYGVEALNQFSAIMQELNTM